MTSTTVDLGSEIAHDVTPERRRNAAADATSSSQSAAAHGFTALGKVRRIARGLLPALLNPGADTLVFAEFGFGKQSAVWLTKALAEVLAETLNTHVTVLVLADARRYSDTHDSATGAQSQSIVEVLDTYKQSALHLGLLLEQKLHELEAKNGKVLVHFTGTSSLDLLGHMESCAGAVLLSKAGKTRKAVMTSSQMRLQQLGVPLLGAVLLDRQYPIPAALYNLL